ncbi:uncharacterized protein LOC131849524 [Achroia grisella]|uniref:uncharacterized protein LOC131849524 n=1 Tax=Achroia grisella TaxID=688607 RepID=UPI0027D28BCC|nr:uncharacterized protein LOC131849524 [Achroia grisella]
MEAAMLFSATLILLLCGTNAEYTVKCNNGTQKSLTLERSDDDVKSRYIVQWCTAVDTVESEWNVALSYNTNLNKVKCSTTAFDFVQIARRWNKHSEIRVPFHGKEINCTNVCFMAPLDLIFSSCYFIESSLPAMSSQKTNAHRYISNEYTIASFINRKIYADAIYHE